MLNTTVVTWIEMYLNQILHSRGALLSQVGELPYIRGFDDYNKFVQINSLFSTFPTGIPIDRTLSTSLPLKYYIPRPWTIPTQQWTLDQAMEQRVANLLALPKKINLMWSGGIDSTALVTAFLKHTTKRDQLRIMYSPWSIYEHPEYFNFLKKFNGIEMVDLSGLTYMHAEFDGIYVFGDGGDELLSSLDESFVNKVGIQNLHSSWIDFFYNKTNDTNLIEFCQKHFALSGRPIETILHARWWFYTCCKSRAMLSKKAVILYGRDQFNIDDIQGFYDCAEFENYIYWNIEDSISGSTYSTWKQILKDYAFKFDGFDNWRNTKTKYNSIQTVLYGFKKAALTDKRWFALDSAGNMHSTPSLPILTTKEFNKYTNLDWAFN